MGRGEHRRQNHHKKFKVLKDHWHKLHRAKNINLYFKLNKIHIGITILKRDHVSEKPKNKIKAYGQLVLLGFVVTNFTPIAYQRHSL